MPKLYEYFGILVMFYSNEHEPVHVHGKCQGREGRAEIILRNGVVESVRFRSAAGRLPLSTGEQGHFEELVRAKAADIVQKWIDFFVLNKTISPERITTRLR